MLKPPDPTEEEKKGEGGRKLAFTETVPKTLTSLSLPGAVCRGRAAPAATISSLVTGCAQPQQAQGPPSPPSQHRFSRASTFGAFPQRPLLAPLAVTLPWNYSPRSGRTCKMVLKITYCEEQVYAMKQPLQRNIRQIQASCAQILNLWRKKMPLPPLWLFWLKE